MAEVLAAKQPYTAEEAELLLKSPLPDSEQRWSPQTELMLQNTARNSRRVRHFQLVPDSRWFQGNWFYQGPNTTCTPWSIINCIYALGGRLVPEHAAALLNLALKFNGEPGGVNLNEAMSLVNQMEAGGVAAEILHPSISLRFMPGFDEVFETQVRLNGLFIKRVISGGDLIVCTVSPRYTRSQRDHALGLVGYCVNQDQTMMVQVVDSARGIYPVPIEHLTRSLSRNKPEVYRFYRRNGLDLVNGQCSNHSHLAMVAD